MTTLTSTLGVSTVPARALHAGNQSVNGSITSTLTASAGLVYQLCALPKNAIVSDIKILGGNGVCTTSVGVTQDEDAYFNAVSTSPAASLIGPTATAGYTYKTVTPTYLIVTTDAVSAASADGSMRFSVTYHLDDLTD